jgi:chondroitin synthase
MQLQKPKVCIVTTVYDRMAGQKEIDWLETAVGSVLSQSYQNILLILWNNQTGPVVERKMIEYSNLYKNVKYIKSNWNYRSAFATKMAWELSSEDAKYFAVVDSDDYIEENAVMLCVDYLEKNPDYPLVFTYHDFVNDVGKLTHRKGSFRDNFSQVDPTQYPHFRMVNREFYNEVGGISIKYDICWFYDLSLKLRVYGPYGVIRKVLYHCRQHKSHHSTRYRGKVNKEIMEILNNDLVRRNILDQYYVKSIKDGTGRKFLVEKRGGAGF